MVFPVESKNWWRFGWLLLVLVGVVWVSSAVVKAATAVSVTTANSTIQVTTVRDELNNDGDCSLREAIETGNTDNEVDGCVVNGSGPYIILLETGSYFISRSGKTDDLNQTGDFDLLADMTIQGINAQSTIIDANLEDRIFDIDPNDMISATIMIANVTIQNGYPLSGTGGGGIRNIDDKITLQNSVVTNNRLTGSSGNIANGAGIFNGSGFGSNLGELIVMNSVIKDNLTSFGGGGGIYNDGGQVQISNSTIENNEGGILSGTSSGGGIANTNGRVNIVNSAILNNRIDGQGGGINNFSSGVMNIANSTVRGNESNGSGGGFRNSGTLILSYVTISENTADSDGNGFGRGGGIRDFLSGETIMKASIVYGNVDGTPVSNGSPIHPNLSISGTFTSTGYNVIETFVGPTGLVNGVNNDLVGVDPQLVDPTDSDAYFVLPLGSPVLNLIPSVNCTFIGMGINPLFTDGAALTGDQVENGRPDPITNSCDPGAVESSFGFTFLPYLEKE